MTSKPNDHKSDQFQAAAQALPPIEVDCSGWDSDIPEEQWSTGRFVSGLQALPPLEVDCSSWQREDENEKPPSAKS